MPMPPFPPAMRTSTISCGRAPAGCAAAPRRGAGRSRCWRRYQGERGDRDDGESRGSGAAAQREAEVAGQAIEPADVFMSWISSRMRVRFPSVRRAASRASSSGRPRATLSAVSLQVASSSRARSRSHRPARAIAASASRQSRRAQHLADRAHEAVPSAGLGRELPTACRCQTVVARLAIVLGRAPERGDPAAVLEPMQRGVERAVLDLQNVFRTLADDVRDGVPVRRPGDQRLEGLTSSVPCSMSGGLRGVPAMCPSLQ